MENKGALPPEQVLQDLSPLHPVLYRVLEQAVEEARAFFETRDEKNDVYLFPHVVRYCALRLLDAANNRDVSYTLHALTNNGLQIECRGYLIRIWKANEGELPAPGSSLAKQAFYQQLTLFGPEPCLNLAVIWDVDGNYSLEKLFLVRPHGNGNPWQKGQVEWQISIPHPADTLVAEPHFSSRPEDIDLRRIASKKAETKRQ